MKILAILLTFLPLYIQAGLPPTTLTAQQVSPNVTTFNFKVPNFQATQLSAINSLIETGNKNQLANPSFENLTPGSSWTLSGGTFGSLSTVMIIDGSFSQPLNNTGAWSLSQTNALYAVAKVGQQAEASIWVETFATDVWLCPYVNTTVVTASVSNGCMQYTGAGSPQKLTVYPLYGNTSNGIQLSGSSSSTVFVDDAYFGDRKGIGTFSVDYDWIDSGITAGTTGWSGFSTLSSISIQKARVGANLFLRGVFTAGSMANTSYRIPLPDSLTMKTLTATDAPLGTFTASTASGSSQFYLGQHAALDGYMSAYSWASAGGYTLVTSSSPMPSAGTFYFTAGPIPISQWQSNAVSMSIAGTNFTQTLSGSTITGVTTAPTKGTTVADNIQVTKLGNRLIADYTFQQSAAGTAGSGDYLFALPVVNGTQLQFDSTIFLHTGTNILAAGARAYVGTGRVSDSTNAVYSSQLVAYDATHFRVAAATGTTAAFVGSSSFPLSNSAEGFGLHLDAQISGWTNLSNNVVAMTGVLAVPGAIGGVDSFKFSYGATATGACSTGTCAYLNQQGSAVVSVSVSGTTYTLITNKTYLTIKCLVVAMVPGTGSALGILNSQTPGTSFTFSTLNSTQTAVNTYGTADCTATY